MSDATARAKKIKLVIFDVDGVMTDGSLFLGDDGQEYKAFNSLDGHGMKMLRRTGVEMAIITGRSSRVVPLRAQNLGIHHLYQGVEDKLEAFHRLLDKLGLEPSQTAYMGDDVVDLPVMRRCGLAVCVPGAPEIVRRHSHLVTALPGGRGAVRELCEFLMRAQGTFDSQMAIYLE
jgi:3-deoxy-D-manno-octulosonate 8-phosphate phosphatase (KDO 8-P phosphatase)